MEGIYRAIIRREAVESIEHQRRDMIAACYANPNWDGKDNAEKRKEYLDEINVHFNKAITAIYHPEGSVREVDVDWSNPFFAAHKREMVRTRELFGLNIAGEDGDKPIGEIVDAEQRVDQQEQPSTNGHSRRGDDLDQYEIPRNQ